MTPEEMHIEPPHQPIAEFLAALADPTRLQAVLDDAPECLFIIAPDGVVTYANAEALRVLEAIEPLQVIGKAMVDHVAPEHRIAWCDYHARVCAGARLAWEYEVDGMGGQRRWIESHALPLELPGRGVGQLSIGREVAGRSQLHSEATERSLAQLQAVISSMAEGLILSDAAGNLVQWNKAALTMHGYATEEEVRQHVSEFRSLYSIDAGDGEQLPIERWPIPRVLSGETFKDYELRLERRDTGLKRIISYSGAPMCDRDGRVTLAVLTLHDVTEQRRVQALLRQSEARLKLALSIAEMGTFDIDLRDDSVVFNDAGRAIYGFSPEQPLSFEFVKSHFHPEDTDAVVEQVRDALRPDGLGQFDLQHRIIRADNAVRWIRARGQAIFDRVAGERVAVSLVGTYLDVTEQKEADNRREAMLAAERTARNEAERSSRLKDEFLATLSHELRTPLTAILGWSQILRGGARDEQDLMEGLETIERNARAQTKIVEDLLDMSRIISGKVRLDVQRVDLGHVIANAVDTVRHAADAKGVQLHVVLDPNAGPVMGDPNRLQQVVWNLLSNAIKFTPGGGRVQVLLERVHSHIEIRVADTGEGIRGDFLPHVFDRFKQADASTTRRHGGLGLGLSIVKQLIELHGGTVHAASGGPGQGAMFDIRLPVTPILVESERPRSREHPAVEEGRALLSAADCPTLKGVHVLVVDDEADARSLVRRLLEDCEATVTTAASAGEAIEAIEAHPPQVLVSDIGMPGEDGFQLIRRVRKMASPAARAVPAVALTAYARSEDRRKAIVAGYQLHVAKPVEPVELIAVVASLAKRTLPTSGD